MDPKEFLENQLLLNPLLAPIGIAVKVAGALGQGEAAKKAQQSTQAKPEKPSTQPDLPTQQPIPPEVLPLRTWQLLLEPPLKLREQKLGLPVRLNSRKPKQLGSSILSEPRSTSMYIVVRLKLPKLPL